MDILSIVLLSALNIPVLLFCCRIIQRRLSGGRDDFWSSLLSWSFDPHAFFDKEHKHNHIAVLLLSLSVACCIILILVEYELAYRFVDGLRLYQPLQAWLKF
jgi:hypothetical protein